MKWEQSMPVYWIKSSDPNLQTATDYNTHLKKTGQNAQNVSPFTVKMQQISEEGCRVKWPKCYD